MAARALPHARHGRRTARLRHRVPPHLNPKTVVKRFNERAGHAHGGCGWRPSAASCRRWWGTSGWGPAPCLWGSAGCGCWIPRGSGARRLVRAAARGSGRALLSARCRLSGRACVRACAGACLFGSGVDNGDGRRSGWAHLRAPPGPPYDRGQSDGRAGAAPDRVGWGPLRSACHLCRGFCCVAAACRGGGTCGCAAATVRVLRASGGTPRLSNR